MKKLLLLFLLAFSFLIGKTQKLDYKYQLDSLYDSKNIGDSIFDSYKIKDSYIQFYIQNDTAYADFMYEGRMSKFYPVTNLPKISFKDSYIKGFDIKFLSPVQTDARFTLMFDLQDNLTSVGFSANNKLLVFNVKK